MVHHNKKKNQASALANKPLPRSVHIFAWALITAFLITIGLPLLYEIYLNLTPSLEPHIERETKAIAEKSALIIGFAVFALGTLLAIKRWRFEIKQARLKALVQDYKRRKKMKS